jgi:two-component system sensor histidine kinase PhcS
MLRDQVSKFLAYRKDKNYLSELQAYMLFYNRRACLITAGLIISGVGLDFFNYRAHVGDFFVIRLFATFSILISLVISETEIGKRYVKYIVYSWMSIPQIMIAYMICLTGAEQSIYFVGLTFALAGLAFILPISIFEAFIFGIFTLLCYAFACSFHNPMPIDLNRFIGNSILILFFSVISIAIAIYNEIWRWEAFQLKRNLADKNLSLEQSNRNLAEIKGHMIQQEKMSALGTLSAGLLHELNNPVNYSMMAIGMAELEPEINSNTMLKESLADAKEGMTRVRDIVMDLKTFAYQKPGEDTSRVFLFENAVRSALRLSGFELKDISVVQDLPIDTHVLGDEPAMIGVLINLVTNAALALKKSEHENPTIHIKAWRAPRSSDDKGRLFVTVRDNGTGIKPENLTRVFEPFFTTRDVGHGLGLGLAVSYAIIQRHGSELTVTSSLGEWTEFAFDLPVGNNV